MKSIPLGKLTAWTGILSILLASNLAAQDTVLYKAKPGGKIVIAGTSTIHDWTVETKIIGGSLELEAGYPLDPSQAELPDFKTPAKVEVKIPVTSLKSGKQRMDEVMYEAMNHVTHRSIDFKLVKLTPHNAGRKAGAPAQFDSEGKLTVHGVTKDVKFPVTIVPEGDDRLKVKGKVKIKMTDFGINPPAPKIALGLIRTGDEVDLDFDWIVGESKSK